MNEFYQVIPKVDWRVSPESGATIITEIKVQLVPRRYAYSVVAKVPDSVKKDIRTEVSREIAEKIVDRQCVISEEVTHEGKHTLYELNVLEEKEKAMYIDKVNALNKELTFKDTKIATLKRRNIFLKERMKNLKFWELIKLAFTKKENRAW